MNNIQYDYDVAVIGGGIQGAGVAQAAAAAGYKTLIIEKQHWAAGTSSKSSKLIHGGLRYLESGQIPLVWESLKERRLLLKNAPDLVKPLEFMIPCYPTSLRRPWLLWLGLTLYSLLSIGSNIGGFKHFRRKSLPPIKGLKQQGLQHIFSYWDAQTNDKNLTASVIQSAQQLGATALTHTKLIKAVKTDSGYQLTTIKTTQPPSNEAATTPQESAFSCRILINAGGPWVNQIIQTIEPATNQLDIDWVKGSHIIVNHSFSDKAFYLEAPQDQRAVFVLPWYGQTLVGTTERLYEGDANNVQPSNDEIDYLTNVLSFYFPDVQVDITSSFAGLRVLPKTSSTLFSRPRDCTFFQHRQHPHLLSLYGGKLTGYRHTAEQVIKKIRPLLPETKPIANTAELTLLPVES